MERMVLNLKRQEVPVPEDSFVSAVVTYLGDEAKETAISLASQLRSKGIGAILAPAGRSLKAQMRYANSLRIPSTLILGEDEIKNGTVILRNMTQGTQREVSLQSVAEELESPTTS